MAPSKKTRDATPFENDVTRKGRGFLRARACSLLVQQR
jgi:hypothetical protein